MRYRCNVGRFRGWVQIASTFVVLVGLVVCGGWLFGIAALQRLHPHLASMKLNTATALVLIGLALRFSLDGAARVRSRRRLALAAVAIGGATLAEYVLDANVGIDELLRADPTTFGVPGRMALATAGCVVVLGAALACLETCLAEWLALGGALFAHVALLGYLYGIEDLYVVGPFASVPLHTAGALYVLAIGIVLSRPQRGLMRFVASDSPGGVLARRLLPAAVVLPAVLPLVRQWGEHSGLYSPAVGRALLVTSTSVVFLILIWGTAAAVVRADQQRRAAESSVREREAYLAISNERLRVLAEVSSTFARAATDYQALLDQIVRTIADIVGDGCMITLLSADGELLLGAANAHRDAVLELDYKDYFIGFAVPKATSSSIAAQVARSGEPLRADILPAAMVAQTEEVLKPLVARLNVHGFAVVPIRARQIVIGTLSLMRSAPGRSYTADDVTLLQDLADRAGLAIENARLYERLEQRVRERTAELETANQELEAFSYSVAHDLRSPLRGISGFSRAVLEDYADRLDADGVEHLQRIEAGAQRMAHLLDDLLDLARVSRAEVHRTCIDLSAMARGVVARLQISQPREIDLIVQDGLVVEADPRLLDIVLTNLLGNAWKFTGKRAHARIELGAQRDTGTTIYMVRDNGVGFEAAYLGKLFGVFQRLHTVHEFEGTGIGLAIAQRIIHRHGGRIWAEGQVDRGATFFFTLEPTPAIRASGRRLEAVS